MGTSDAIADRRPPRLRLAHVWLTLPWIGIVVAANRPIRDNSFLWHIRAGDLQLASGEVLRADPFSFTRFGEPWRTQSWLLELLYSIGHEAFGLAFRTPMLMAFGVLIFAGIAVASYRASRDLAPTTIAVLLAMVLVFFYVVPRPVSAGLALLAILIVADSSARTRWTTPLLLWLWAAVHASWVLGIGYLVLSAMRRGPRRDDALRVAAGLVAVTLTAHGVGVWAILWDFATSSEAIRAMSEWQPPNFTLWPNLALLIVVLVIMWGATKGRLASSALWLVAPFFVYAVTSQRAMTPGIMVLAPLAAEVLPTGKRSRPPGSLAVNWVLVLVVLGLPFWLEPPTSDVDDERFPVTAAEFLPPERAFHDDAAGGYLIYRFPERQVFIDDRAELFDELILDLGDLRSARIDHKEIFARYGIDLVLLRSDEVLVRFLAREGWTAVYADSDWRVMVAPAR